MLKGIVLLIVAFVLVSCVKLNKFDESTGTFENDKESVGLGSIAEREEGIKKSLKEHGKLKVVVIKERNPVTDWILGGMMALGAFSIVGGIVWTGYNILYMAGKFIKSGILAIAGGLVLFGSSYLLMEYLWVLLTLLGIAFAVGIGWLVWYLKENRGMFGAAVETVDVAIAGGDDTSTQDAMRKAQGKHQPFFKAMKNK